MCHKVSKPPGRLSVPLHTLREFLVTGLFKSTEISNIISGNLLKDLFTKFSPSCNEHIYQYTLIPAFFFVSFFLSAFTQKSFFLSSATHLFLFILLSLCTSVLRPTAVLYFLFEFLTKLATTKTYEVQGKIKR